MEPEGKSLAIIAESLYLVNLLLAPGLAFVLLLAIYLVKKHSASPLALNHLSQATGVSFLGGALIVVVVALFVVFGGHDSAYTWMAVLFYFTFVHSSLIMMGVFGLIKALNGQHFSYPLLGRLFTL